MRKILLPLLLLLSLAASSLAKAATALETEVIWTVPTAAPIYARPVLDGDTIYVGDESGVLRALDAATGQLLWEYSAEAGVGSSAGVDEARVYVMSRDGKVHCIDKTNGEGIWTFSTGGEKQWDPWDLFLSTPVPDGKHSLYFGSGDHHVYSVNKRTGALRWKVETGAVVHGTPALSGQKVVVGSFDGTMYALDQADGRALWTFKTVGNSHFRNGEIAGSPTVEEGIVYFGSRDYNVYAILEETGTGAWNERTPSWVIGQPLVLDGVVYVATSDGPRIFSFEASTGRERWETTLGLNVFSAAAPLGEAYVAVAGLDGRVTILERETGKIRGFHDTAKARENRGTFFDADDTLHSFEIRTWEDLFALYDRYYTDLGGIAGGLTIADDVIYYATGSGSITAVRVTGIDSPSSTSAGTETE